MMTGVGAGMGFVDCLNGDPIAAQFPDIMRPARSRVIDWRAAVLPGMDEARQGTCFAALHCQCAAILKTNDEAHDMVCIALGARLCNC